MTPERKVKNAVEKLLSALGAYYFYPVTGGYGGSGQPDIVGCFEGRFFGIECKAKGNRPTALQLHRLRVIRKAGGVALLANEETLERLPDYLRLGTSNVE